MTIALITVEGCVDKAVATRLVEISGINVRQRPIIIGGWTSILRRGVDYATRLPNPVTAIIDANKNAQERLERATKNIMAKAKDLGYEVVSVNVLRELNRIPYVAGYIIKNITGKEEKTLYLILWGNPFKQYETGTVEDLLLSMMTERFEMKPEMPRFCMKCPCKKSPSICSKQLVLVALASCSCMGTIALSGDDDRCGLSVYDALNNLGLDNTTAAKDYIDVFRRINN